MFKIVDRLLSRFVPKVTASAACTVTRSCVDCPAPRQQYGRYLVYRCCRDEGCTTSYTACKTCA